MTKPHYETEIVLTQLQQQEQLPKYIHTDCIKHSHGTRANSLTISEISHKWEKHYPSLSHQIGTGSP